MHMHVRENIYCLQIANEHIIEIDSVDPGGTFLWGKNLQYGPSKFQDPLYATSIF